MKQQTKQKQGLFVTLEGTEGSGKTTLATALSAHFTSLGFEVVTTREPGGSPVAEKIRALVLAEEMNAFTEAWLYESARIEHLHKTVLPALARGALVICDRFTDSTLAYQGSARGLEWKYLKNLNKMATQGLVPNATLFLELNPRIGLERATDPNKFEAEGLAFQQKVLKGFKRAQKENSKRFAWIKVDKLSREQVAKKAIQMLEKKLPRLKKAKA